MAISEKASTEEVSYIATTKPNAAKILAQNEHINADTLSEVELILHHRKQQLVELASEDGPVFSYIIVTAANEGQAEDFRRELELRRRVIDGKHDVISQETQIIAVADPDGIRLGSGGATLEALRQIPEIKGRILILHSGGDSRRLPLCSVRGKAFCELPTASSVASERTDGRLKAPIDFLLEKFHDIARNSPSGVFVLSTDLMLRMPSSKTFTYVWGPHVTGLGIFVPVQIGTRHGVYKYDENFNVVDIIQKGSEFTLREDGFVVDNKVCVDTGVIWLSAEICERLRTSNIPRLRRFELYSDMLLCLNNTLKYEEYMDLPWESNGNSQIRETLWEILRPYSMTVIIPPEDECTFAHLGTIEEYLEAYVSKHIFSELYEFDYNIWSEVHDSEISENCCVINSILNNVQLAEQSLIEHCNLNGAVIESGAIASCVESVPDIHIRSGVSIQELQLGGRQYVITSVGVKDNMKKPFHLEGSTFLGVSWTEFLTTAGIKARQIWPGVGQDSRKTLWNANLFPMLDSTQKPDHLIWFQDLSKVTPELVTDWASTPRLSFSRCLQLVDPSSELRRRRTLWSKIVLNTVIEVLAANGTQDVTHLCHQFLYEQPNLRNTIFQRLEQLRISSADNPTVCQRTTNTVLRCLKALLEIVGGDIEGSEEEEILVVKEINILELTEKYRQWTNYAPMVRQVWKYYEKMHKELIREHTLTAKYNFFKTEPYPIKEWVRIDCPARIDLAGGWSDTPPVCYTLNGGGMVVNAAVDIGQEIGKECGPPISCRAKRIATSQIILKSGDVQVRCSTLEDMKDFRNPRAPLTLFKCVFVILGLVNMESGVPLSDQLKDGGYELISVCNLPQGSGLGTSSILAGCVLRAVGKVAGIEFDNYNLMHLVLHVEQLLTTGGGWQDQVGGIYPGLKICSTDYGLPLDVTTELIEQPEMVNKLNQRLLLIFTGKRRIAKDILERVINRWSRRSERVCKTVEGIVSNAKDMVDAIQNCDLERFGECLTLYDNQKDFITDGSRTPVDIVIREKLKSLTLGMAICGAGGGGFMTVVTREVLDDDLMFTIRDLLQDEIRNHGVSLWNCRINTEGLQIKSEVKVRNESTQI